MRWFGWIWLLVIVAVLACLLFYNFYFLRKPNRYPPHSEKVFVSPAQWKIIWIYKNTDPRFISVYKQNKKVLDSFTSDLGSNVTMVSIMMTPMDVHRQRSPQEAQLLSQEYVTGKFLNAMKNAKSLDATLQNEYNSMLFETSNGTKYKVIQIAGFVARRIESFLTPDQKVKQGEVIGLIKLWSQVTIIFDDSVEVIGQVWQYVTEWESILAIQKVD